jgi:pilus assembly protein CpaE
MMNQNYPKRIVVVQDNATMEILNRLLDTENYQLIEAHTDEEAYNLIIQSAPSLVILESALPGFDGYGLCRYLRQDDDTRDLPILMLSSRNDVSAKIAGFEAGVDDYVTKPFQDPELVYRIRTLIARKPRASEPRTQPQGHGKVIALFGTKGGVGRTTIAVNLAVALAYRTRARVALFDADFFFGDMALHLNVPPSRTILDLIDHVDQLDLDLMDQVLVSHPSGVRALISPRTPEKVEMITAHHVDKVLTFLSDHYDYVIVDCQSSYEERMLTVLERADAILLVIKPEVGCIKNMAIFSELAVKLGFPLEKLYIVLNRSGSNSGIDPKEIERVFKRQIAFHIGSGGRAVVISINRGVPLIIEQPNHPFALQVRQIADHLIRTLPVVQ